MLAVFPDRTDCVDDMPGGQIIAPGELGVAGFAAAQSGAFLQQPRPGGPVNGAVDATATQQGVVGGIDDGIHCQGGDVGLNNFDGSFHRFLISGFRGFASRFYSAPAAGSAMQVHTQLSLVTSQMNAIVFFIRNGVYRSMAHLIQKLLRPACTVLMVLTTGLCLYCSSVAPVGAHTAPPSQVQDPSTGLDEHLGSKIPLDLRFRDESGAVVRLGDLVTGPTIILPVYYTCKNVCAYQQGRMASTLQVLDRRPIYDYRVISISFDETETPELAARSKRTYLTAMRKPFPPDGWRFLTGDADNIRRFTEAIGFRFQRKGDDFIHPVASVVLSADGTIIRYLYGIGVLPKDLALAIAEAKSGVAGVSVRKMMEYCFTFDPVGKTYVCNLLRVSATVVILCAGSFLLYLLVTGKKRKRPQSEKS